MRNVWLFFMDFDGGSPYIDPTESISNSFGGHLLSHVTSFVDNSVYGSRRIYAPGSAALQEAFDCISKFAGAVLLRLSSGSNSNIRHRSSGDPHISKPKNWKSCAKVDQTCSCKHNLTGFCFSSRSKGKASGRLPFDEVSNFTIRQFCREVQGLESMPVFTLAAALVPPLDNLTPKVMAVPLEDTGVRSCEIEHQRSSHFSFPDLNWTRHAVEPRTGIEFPTILDNILVGENNSSLTSEVLVGTGSRTMKIIKIKSLKVYAFGFYVHPLLICEKLGPKYASIPVDELNKRQDFYEDLLREDINMTVRLVVNCNGMKINTVRDAFEKSLRNRLLKTNPDTDYQCLTTFGSYFTQDIPLPAGTTIDFRRTADGQLITETIAVAWLALFEGFFGLVNGSDINYKDALTKSLIFLEAQRSGKLPANNRLPWRGDSALEDGKLVNADLVGGYYDAGDNVKYGLPMAFTVTTLSWSAIFYESELKATGELENTRDAIKWGTDYFLKAYPRKNRLYVQVGDPVQDHQCWMRPENMETPRTVLMIDDKMPGTEIAAETSAAMASSSIVFRGVDRAYARRLLNKAKLLFEFAKAHKGTYDGECPFYCSFSGYNDELLWAATWLYIATRKPKYLKYIQEESISASVAEFSWDLKYAGAQILLSKFYFEGEKGLETLKNQADSFICSVLPDSPYHQIYLTPGGMVHLRDGANTQYVTGTAHLFSVYSNILAQFNQKVVCGGQQFDHTHLMAFAKQQMDYLLGKNPEGRSYMVGFGNNPPTQAHHRGASVPKLPQGSTVSCAMSFVYWFNKNDANPNELTGAILGGPDRNDNFDDKRWDSSKTEPCTYVNSLAVGVLSHLAMHNA